MTADRDKAREIATELRTGSKPMWAQFNEDWLVAAIATALSAARAEERERCARVADAIVANNGINYEDSDGAFLAASDIASAICADGQADKGGGR